jgi:hypothetical protein
VHALAAPLHRTVPSVLCDVISVVAEFMVSIHHSASHGTFSVATYVSMFNGLSVNTREACCWTTRMAALQPPHHHETQ